MDSQGSYDCNGNMDGKSCITSDAVAWFAKESKLAQTSARGDIIFTTYPTQEFMDVANGNSAKGGLG